MRRTDREMTNRNELIQILQKADVCRIAINSFPAPYIVPLNFGYKWDEKLELFFHCANEGRKLTLLSENNSVGFEIDIDHELVKAEKACGWGMKYKSIIGFGKITEIPDEPGKMAGLDRIMKHYGFFDKNIDYDKIVLGNTKVLKLDVIEISGKQKT
jgi:nitroimidazol reductase NimA-like FMN-containing flavoprotein (pyridoxamine 5'-phosphate oxidase superfamily)